MSEALGLHEDFSPPRLRTRVARRFLRDRVVARMAGVRDGQIHIREGSDYHRVVGEATGRASIDVRVNDARFWAMLAFQGSVGVGEAYARGFWDCSDLSECLALFVRNRHVLEGIDEGSSRISAPLRWAVHKLRSNTKTGSRRNISAHYDLGNEFFALWLDPSMTYSSAIFEDGMDLEAAQTEKFDRLCRQLDLAPGSEVCEIGTGWGGMALHLARHYDCRVVTTTISARQAEYARANIAAAGLADRVQVLEEDYRDLVTKADFEGRFDAVVSIEMVEAVGHAFLPRYFETCSKLLKPGGRFGLQAITIAEQHFELAKRNVDFIQKFIFPGCAIPSVGSICAAIAEKADLRVVTTTDYAQHYARTLRVWRDRFLEESASLDAMGYDRFFRRLWEFYFSYCEAGFAEHQLGLHQMILERPRGAVA